MTRTIAARTVTAGIVCAALLSVAHSAQATPLQRLDGGRVAVAHADRRDAVTRLLVEGHLAATTEQRRLIHHELVQTVLDGE